MTLADTIVGLPGKVAAAGSVGAAREIAEDTLRVLRDRLRGSLSAAAISLPCSAFAEEATHQVIADALIQGAQRATILRVPEAHVVRVIDQFWP